MSCYGKPEERIKQQKRNRKNEKKPGFPNRGNYALNNFQGRKDTNLEIRYRLYEARYTLRDLQKVVNLKAKKRYFYLKINPFAK